MAVSSDSRECKQSKMGRIRHQASTLPTFRHSSGLVIPASVKACASLVPMLGKTVRSGVLTSRFQSESVSCQLEIVSHGGQLVCDISHQPWTSTMWHLSASVN